MGAQHGQLQHLLHALLRDGVGKDGQRIATHPFRTPSQCWLVQSQVIIKINLHVVNIKITFQEVIVPTLLTTVLLREVLAISASPSTSRNTVPRPVTLVHEHFEKEHTTIACKKNYCK